VAQGFDDRPQGNPSFSGPVGRAAAFWLMLLDDSVTLEHAQSLAEQGAGQTGCAFEYFAEC
jgi:hypothetical protein